MESVNIKTLFSDEALAIAEKHVAKFPEGKSKSAIIAILHLAQAELGGWLSPEVMDYVASILKIEPIEVYEVATFYSQYYTEPVGKYVLEVCHTGPCALRGADEMVSYLEKKTRYKRRRNHCRWFIYIERCRMPGILWKRPYDAMWFELPRKSY